MKVNLYAIHDAKAKNYSPPFPGLNDQSAIRDFTEQCANPENKLNKYPFDFTLFSVGTLDDETGLIVSQAPPEMLITANNALDNLREEQIREKTQVSRRLETEHNKMIELLNALDESAKQAKEKIDEISNDSIAESV